MSKIFIPKKFATAAAKAELSEREAQVIYLMASGETVKSTASMLGISFSTVVSYSFRARAKLHARSIASAVFLLMQG